MEHTQFHLNAPACSGRGVRVRMLSPDEANKVMADAARLVGPEASIIELKKTEWSLGVKAMLTEYTVEKNLPDLMKEGVQWRKVDRVFLDENYSKIFGAKDDAILQAIYRQFHEVSEKDIEAVVSKALPVSVG